LAQWFATKSLSQVIVEEPLARQRTIAAIAKEFGRLWVSSATAGDRGGPLSGNLKLNHPVHLGQ